MNGPADSTRPSATEGHPEQQEPGAQGIGWGVIGVQRDRATGPESGFEHFYGGGYGPGGGEPGASGVGGAPSGRDGHGRGA
ncbi:hypothetical protein J7E86_22250, partial [Streptomyces sp. ISL-11]|nr:hypothetical protein [Streptomyces sp. ISL-11]